MNDVTEVDYLGGYVYRVTFDDGTSGDVDFTEYLDAGPVFAPLRDVAFFRQARIEGGTIAWPNGADIAPETLHEKVAASVEAQAFVVRDQPADPPGRKP
jgi:hypothetical protein